MLEILDPNHQTQEPGEWHEEVCIASERFRFEEKAQVARLGWHTHGGWFVWIHGIFEITIYLHRNHRNRGGSFISCGSMIWTVLHHVFEGLRAFFLFLELVEKYVKSNESWLEAG